MGMTGHGLIEERRRLAQSVGRHRRSVKKLLATRRASSAVNATGVDVQLADAKKRLRKAVATLRRFDDVHRAELSHRAARPRVHRSALVGRIEAEVQAVKMLAAATTGSKPDDVHQKELSAARKRLSQARRKLKRYDEDHGIIRDSLAGAPLGLRGSGVGIVRVGSAPRAVGDSSAVNRRRVFRRK